MVFSFNQWFYFKLTRFDKNHWLKDERSSSSFLRKTISEPQRGIGPTTFWWLVRRFNHWVTKTQMDELRCKFDIYVRPERKPLYVNNETYEIDIYLWDIYISEIVFLEVELDKRISLIQHTSKLTQFKIYISLFTLLTYKKCATQMVS